MIYFSKKLMNKIKVYLFYLLKKETRKFFFILVNRKIYQIFYPKKNIDNNKYLNWFKKKKISDNNFYRKVGIVKPRNFFKDNKNYYLSAKLKEKRLEYRMGGKAHLNLLYNLVIYLKPKNILETGVAFGWSTLVFLLSKKKFSKLTSIDLSYPTSSSDKYVAMALPANFKNKLSLIRGIDYDHLNILVKKKKFFDFIHYDSDKSYIGRKKNYLLIWKILKKNGCFISDDISDNAAFYEFINSKKIKYFILKKESKYIGIAFK
mgnify:CR=1 FL=1